MADSVSRKIIEAADVRLEGLGLNKSNTTFLESEMPATVKDAFFTTKWQEGSLNVDQAGVNRKIGITRSLEIKIYYSLLRTAQGDKSREAVLDAYDTEEEVISSFLSTRLTTDVRVERLLSSEMELSTFNDTEWFVNTMAIEYVYELSV